MVEQEPSPSQGSSRDAARLADYLRANPHAVHESPETLAQDAGVSVDVIRRVSYRVQPVAHVRDSGPRVKLSAAAPMSVLGKAFAWMTERTPWVVGASWLFIFVSTILVGSAEGAREGGLNLELNNPVIATMSLVLIVLQFALFFRNGRGQVVFRSAVTFYATTMLVALLIAIQADAPPEFGRVGLFFILGIGFLFLAGIYGIAGLLFSVLGALYRVRREEVNRDRMSRQELLERMFDIQERLQQEPEVIAERKSWHNHPLAREIESQIWLWTLVLGTGLSTIIVLITGIMAGRFGAVQNDPKVQISVALYGMISLIVQLALAFLARRVGRALGVSFAYVLFAYLPMFLPIGFYGWESLQQTGLGSLIGNLAVALIFGLVGGIGATIEGRATHQRLMRANDPETLLAEYLDIQARLNPGPREVTVMVVDAARSSVMKSMADPYVAEWSFRAYQQLLERIADDFGGEVLSTAGDGAIITFEDATAAVECASAVHERIREFNERTNKLTMPFRLRIGLHRGTVVGQIDKVQYTDVIDVAAHVEAACSIDGIAVSSRVWESVPDLKGEPIAMLIDGFVVYQLENAHR